MNCFLSLFCIPVFSVFLLSGFPTGASESTTEDTTEQLTIVTATGALTLNVRILHGPEEWSKAASQVGEDASSAGVLTKFSFSRHSGFVSESQLPVDVLFIDDTGQVRGAVERVDDGSFHAFEKPIIAMLFVRAGFIEQNQIQLGNLVLLKDASFGATSIASAAQKRAALKRVEAQLLIASKRSVRSARELGALYLEQRQHEKAIALFSRLVKQDSDVRNRIGFGMALSGAGQVDRAIETFIDVLKIDAANEDAYLHLARIFRYVRKADAIVTVLSSGVAAHPEMLSIRLELAKLYLEVGNLDSAKRVLAEAPGGGETDAAQIERIRGDIYLREGRFGDAANAYGKYLQVFPSAPHAAELRLFIIRHKKEKK